MRPTDEAARDLAPPRLLALFNALESSGVRWSLLRPPQTLASSSGDIDVLIDPRCLSETRRLALAHGFVPLPGAGPDLHALDYDDGSQRFLWLHVQDALRLAGESIPAVDVLTHVVADPLPRPSDPWLLWILLLHGLLDKRHIAERHRPVVQRLAAAHTGGAEPLRRLAEGSGLDAARAVELAAAAEWDELARLARVREETPTSSSQRRLRRAAGRWRGLWMRPGLSVAILGPDGAGKTTLITALTETLPFPVRILYMGLTGGRLPKADALRVPGLVLAARLAIIWTRYLVGVYHRARGRIVLFDRYPLDAAVPSGAPLRPLARLSRRIQGLACPRPDLVLLLDASGATMHERKLEYDPATLEQWRHAYRRLQRRVRGLAVLDAERPADVVRRKAEAAIWRCYRERLGTRS